MRVRGRTRFGCLDGVKKALGSRGMEEEAAQQCEKDGKEIERPGAYVDE